MVRASLDGSDRAGVVGALDLESEVFELLEARKYVIEQARDASVVE